MNWEIFLPIVSHIIWLKKIIDVVHVSEAIFQEGQFIICVIWNWKFWIHKLNLFNLDASVQFLDIFECMLSDCWHYEKTPGLDLRILLMLPGSANTVENLSYSFVGFLHLFSVCLLVSFFLFIPDVQRSIYRRWYFVFQLSY